MYVSHIFFFTSDRHGRNLLVTKIFRNGFFKTVNHKFHCVLEYFILLRKRVYICDVCAASKSATCLLALK